MTTQTKELHPILRSALNVVQSIVDIIKPDKDRAVTSWDIRSAAQKHLNEMGTSNDFGDLIPAGYVMDAYFESDREFVLFTKDDGKLYTLPVTIDDQSQITFGEETEVFMEFSPVSRSVITVSRDVNGKLLGWIAAPACTAVLNRSGEIDSRALFDSFIEHINRTGEYPEMDFFHLGSRLVFGKANNVWREGVGYCLAGYFYDTEYAELAAAAIERDGEYWGTSIQYLSTEPPEIIRSDSGVEIPVFNAGINLFVSLLPEDAAASNFTSIIAKRGVDMDKKIKEGLKTLGFSEAQINAVDSTLDETNRSAKEPGTIMRNKTKPNVLAVKNSAKPAATKAVAAKTAPETPEAPVSVERELNDDDLDALFGNEKFQAKLNDFFEARATSSETEEPVEEEGEPEEEPVTEPAAESDEVRALITSVNALTKKVEAWEKQRAAEEAENADLPEKISIKQIIRPRGRSTILPQSLVAEGRQDVALADVANNTLSRINAGK